MIKVTTDIFQTAMSTLFNDLEHIIFYIDDIIIIGSGSYEERMTLVDRILRLLEYKGLQVNPLKNF